MIIVRMVARIVGRVTNDVGCTELWPPSIIVPPPVFLYIVAVSYCRWMLCLVFCLYSDVLVDNLSLAS